MKNRIFVCLLALAISSAARADEGMWMVNAISRALVQQMQGKGLELEAGEIYNEDKVALTDAIVSLDFGCTGSIVSDAGLLITNHHCAYADIHAISTPEHNYLENGFNARSMADEVYIPGKSVYFLKKVLDLTDEVHNIRDSLKAIGQPCGMRKLSFLLERKYKALTGLEASLSQMWAGSQYYLALYKVYTDIRLVAAPPVSVAAFGGDVDNWEWPQHKCDFALYRVYADSDGEPAVHCAANVPLSPENRLHISMNGYRPGDFSMVIGYPGHTDRYASAAKTEYEQNVSLPIVNSVRGEQMKIISGWMDRDPGIRLKYADIFFSLSNVQELQEGEVECYRRFNVVRCKRRAEKKMCSCRDLLQELDSSYAERSVSERDVIYFRESLLRGCHLALIATRMSNSKAGLDVEGEYNALDLRVERDLFRHSVQVYYENVDRSIWGPFQKQLFERFSKEGGCDFDALCEHLWIDRPMTADDDLYRFFTNVKFATVRAAADKCRHCREVSELDRDYTRAMYALREKSGKLQYPDANSTMRLTYGRVSTLRRDGRRLPWQTWSQEILAKEDPSKYDFTLLPEWRKLLEGSRVPVDFITDNDITGGNSGSPVLNSRGELIGLAFDGNKESLASDKSFTSKYNKCVCVDIRFVIWTLKNHMHLDSIVEEMIN